MQKRTIQARLFSCSGWKRTTISTFIAKPGFGLRSASRSTEFASFRKLSAANFASFGLSTRCIHDVSGFGTSASHSSMTSSFSDVNGSSCIFLFVSLLWLMRTTSHEGGRNGQQGMPFLCLLRQAWSRWGFRGRRICHRTKAENRCVIEHKVPAFYSKLPKQTADSKVRNCLLHGASRSDCK
jgi:hypothetical protein